MSLAIVARLSSLHRPSSRDDSASILSQDAAPSLGVSSLSSSSVSSDSDSRSSSSEPSDSLPIPRHNEHLAVLLNKTLWKPDSQAAHCDTFMCRRPFSIWERRHHCRKCGGVFCGDCSGRTTNLLDASKLQFLHPPRNIPIQVYDSPISPVLDCRVCDDCFDQIHGFKTPRSPVISKASPITLARTRTASSGPSSVSSSVDTPPEGAPISAIQSTASSRRRRRRGETRTSPRAPTSPLLRSSTPIAIEPEESLGELDAYPLRRASHICKATGGGRWEPKHAPEYVAKRIPGCKAAYELELEREEEERRIRRANPVIIDGDFQLRCPREMEPCSPGGPFVLSTF